jgi:hypothetical protein
MISDFKQKSQTITIKNHVFVTIKNVKKYIFATNLIATKITTYSNKNHKRLQQKYHVFATFSKQILAINTKND